MLSLMAGAAACSAGSDGEGARRGGPFLGLDAGGDDGGGDTSAYRSDRRPPERVDTAVPDTATTADGGATLDGSGEAPPSGAVCEMCQQTSCRAVDGLDLYEPCFLTTAVATEGRAVGTPKKDLCKAVLSCARATGCAATGPEPCYCGAGVSDILCLAGSATGPCKKEIEDAAEGLSAEVVISRAADPEYAIGAAFNLIKYCNLPICGTACFGVAPDGGEGPADGGGGGGGGSGGGSGGSGGGGGSDARETLGPSDVGGQETMGADGPPTTYHQCRTCELASCPDTLSACEDIATTDAGTPKKDLCLSVMACVRATRCADRGDLQPCYCGTASFGGCISGSANGLCKAAIEAAAESTDGAEIVFRFTEPAFGVAGAVYLAQCDFESCNAPCTNGDMPGPLDAAPLDSPTVDAVPLDADAAGSGSESLLRNPRFDDDASFWIAEINASHVWEASRDAHGLSTSGSIAITNTTVVATSGLTMAGSGQCAPAIGGAAYQLTVAAFIGAGQSAGSAGVSVDYFRSADCSGPIQSAQAPALTEEVGSWRLISTTPTAPAGAQSMRVRLVAVKPFSAPPFDVTFDEVRLLRVP